MSAVRGKSYLANTAGHEWAALRKHFPEILREHELALRTLSRVSLAYEQIATAFGVRWRNQQLLDVGAGQLLRQSLVFALDNHVHAIDMELPLRGWWIPDLIRT